MFYAPTELVGPVSGPLPDWSLTCSSPCIDAGYVDEHYPLKDIAGNPRVNDGRIDLGPYEFQIVKGLVFLVSTDTLIMSPSANIGQSFKINANVSWTASADQSWLTLNKESGLCNATVTAFAEENPAPEDRKAMITVSGNGATDISITVIQKAPVSAFQKIPLPLLHRSTLQVLLIFPPISIGH